MLFSAKKPIPHHAKEMIKLRFGALYQKLPEKIRQAGLHKKGSYFKKKHPEQNDRISPLWSSKAQTRN